MKYFILWLLIVVSFNSRSQSVALNTDGSLPDSKAILDIKSSTKGLLIPRVTAAQRIAITSPPNGLLVYDTTFSNFYYSSRGTWNQVGTGYNFWSVSNQGAIYALPPYTVGIGTSIPYSRFHVNGTSWFQGDNTPLPADAGEGIAIGYSGNGYIYAFDYASFQPRNLMLQHGGGNVGIGTTTPQGKLHITQDALTLGLIIENPDVNEYSRLSFINQSSYARWDIAGRIANSSIDDKLRFSNSLYGDVMALTGQGKVGIGTSTPAVKLHIYGSGELLRLSGPTPILGFYDANNVYKGYVWHPGGDNMEMGTGGGNVNGNLSLSIRGTQVLTAQSDYRVRVGSLPSIHATFGQYPKLTSFGPLCIKDAHLSGADEWTFVSVSLGDLDLYKNGTRRSYVNTDGDWNSISDVRLKENIAPFKSALDNICKLQISTYHFKYDNTGKRSFGLIAQNVHNYFPEIVSESPGDDGYTIMGIAYGKTGVIALKGIQEQQVIIQSLQKKIDDLEKRLAAVERK